MNFYLINIFHEAAFPFCTAILEKGLEVCAIGIHPMKNWMEYEENIWMNFGRNANLIYQDFTQFLQGTMPNPEIKVLYFPFHEERHLECIHKLDGWKNPVYIMSKDPEILKERGENCVLIRNDVEWFVHQFLTG